MLASKLHWQNKKERFLKTYLFSYKIITFLGENVNDDVLGDPEVELKLIKNFLESEFVDVQRETAQKILDFINRVNMEKRQMPNKNSPSNA